MLIAMVVTVLFPHVTDILAKLVGVKDGGSLFVYGLALAFVASALNNYLEKQDDRDRLMRLARKIAIIEANTKYKISVKK